MFIPTLVLTLLGAAMPLVSLFGGHGPEDPWRGTGLLLGVWGLSPFVLFPIAARTARRRWVGRMVLALTLIAAVFGAVGYLGLLPRRPGNAGMLLAAFLPVWQWPMALLAGILAVFVPSEEQERAMDEPSGE